MTRFITLALFAILLLPGCTRYQYQIVAPPTVAREIGDERDEVITLGPLEYHFRTVEDRLVTRIYNRGETAIELVGTQSYVVDPTGETQGLPGNLIAPSAFVRLVFPPSQPQPQRVGPSIGFGVGVGISQADERTSTAERPIYLQVSPGTYFWRWRGEGEIRVSLFYRDEAETFRHDFVIGRTKQ